MSETIPKVGGCVRDPDDRRDFTMVCAAKPLARKVDLRKLCSPVENQRRLNSCTANAAVGAMEMLEKKQGIPQKDLSRLFVYYNTRVLDGTVNSDIGAYIRNSVKATKVWGACLESMWPYEPGQVFTKPTRECYDDGEGRQSLEYMRVGQGGGVRQALNDGYPVMFGMIIRESFMNPLAGGIVPVPHAAEIENGGHAMLITGYDLDTGMYLVRNSWGRQWGDNGYCRIPFSLVDDPEVAWGFFIIRSMDDASDHEVVRPENTWGRRRHARLLRACRHWCAWWKNKWNG